MSIGRVFENRPIRSNEQPSELEFPLRQREDRSSRTRSADEVAHFFAFGFEVEGVVGGFGDEGGEAFGDADPVLLEGGDLFGIVGDEADCGDVEEPEDFGGELEVAAVGGVAEFEVGFDGVAAVVLELVGAEFGHEADAAAFLLLVEEDAAAGFGDGGEGELELLAAVAAEGVEDVSGEALGVDADDGRVGLAVWAGGVEVAHDEGDCGFGAGERGGEVGVAGGWIGDDALEAEDAEVSPAGGEVGVGDLANVREAGGFGHRWII